MKNIAELILPNDRRYTNEHIWVQRRDGALILGISDFAQDQLGEIMFVDLPRVDDVFTVDEGFGSVESIKSVNTLHMPVSGRVAAVNNQLEGNPGLVNADCYGKGWMIRISPVEVKDNLLLEAEAYRTALAH